MANKLTQMVSFRYCTCSSLSLVSSSLARRFMLYPEGKVHHSRGRMLRGFGPSPTPRFPEFLSWSRNNSLSFNLVNCNCSTVVTIQLRWQFSQLCILCCAAALSTPPVSRFVQSCWCEVWNIWKLLLLPVGAFDGRSFHGFHFGEFLNVSSVFRPGYIGVYSDHIQLPNKPQETAANAHFRLLGKCNCCYFYFRPSLPHLHRLASANICFK